MSKLSIDEFRREYERNQALSKISNETRVGQVDGIRFDLRHENINPQNWTMDILGGDYGWTEPMRTPTLPFIWFPWYGEFNLDKIKDEVLTEFKDANERIVKLSPSEVSEYQAYVRSGAWKPQKLPRSWIRDEIKDRTPDAIVQAGDYIIVDHVEVKEVDDDSFAWLDDREAILLFVRIANDSGLHKVIDKPIVLYGATKLTYRCNSKPIYAIIERVRRAFGLEKITHAAAKEFDDKDNINAHAQAALWRAANICNWYIPRISKLYYSRNNPRAKLGLEFRRALDDACMLGYAWAKAEADHQMRPFALSALKSKRGAARGGQASGASRSARAAETWQARVKSEALKVRADQPDISQEKLATEILFQLGDDTLPSHPIVVRHISRLERESVLPRRRKRT